MALTARQERFVEEYIKCRNAAEAARRAGYSAKTARSIGAENLTKPDILAEIEARTKEKAMELDEVLGRLADIARGSMEDFVNVGPYNILLDFNKAKERGVLHLIKKLKYDKDGNPEIELYSALDAQKILAQLLTAGPTGTADNPIHVTYIKEIRKSDNSAE